jgi:CBS domain-containing protein
MEQVIDVIRCKGTQVYSIAPNALVFQAIADMVNNNVGSLLVVDGDHLIGIVTERDYLRKVALQGRTSRTTCVAEIMSPIECTVDSAEHIDHCLELMVGRRLRHLPVLHRGRLHGIVSVGDLVKRKLTVQGYALEQLNHYVSHAC